MNDLIPFTYEGHDVRSVLIDDEPWFVAADVATVLGYSVASAMTRTLDSDEKGVQTLHTPGGPQELAIISEPGLFSAVIRSRVPGAQAFKRWVTHDVLPQIRRTGRYEVPAAELTMPSHSEALRGWAREIDAREAAEAHVRELTPKAEYVDSFVAHDDLTEVRVAANNLGIRETALRELLVARSWAYKKFIGRRWSKAAGKLVEEYEWRPYAEKSRYFRVVAQHQAPRHHNNQLRRTMYVTPEGMVALRRLVAGLPEDEVVLEFSPPIGQLS